MTKIIIRSVLILLIASIASLITGCIPTNPVGGTATDPNVLHKVPGWSLSDTAGKPGGPNSKKYDINNDGIDDFMITEISTSYGYFIAKILVLNQTLVQGRVSQLNVDLTIYSYYIPEIPKPHTISAQDTFYDDNITQSPSLFVRNITMMGARTDTHYTGFRITINNEPHYAWVKFTEVFTLNYLVTPAIISGTVTINESGYYKLANLPIKAGVW